MVYSPPMDNAARYSTWVEIDLDAITNNTRLLIDKSGAQLLAVMKADAYGHGAVQIAKAALRGGASWFGVARIEEALELRAAEIYHPLLLLGYLPRARYEEAISNQISLTVWDSAHIQAASQAAARLGQQARLHLKVDTGMGRIGVQVENAVDLARQIAGTPSVVFEGLMTHYARSDERDQSTTDEQELLFSEVISRLDALRLLPPKIHAANSAAALFRPNGSYNLVRTGIALYGLNPSPDCILPPGFQPALSWKAVISHIKTLPPGRGVSYGHEYITQGEERIGTVAIGYADGLRRQRKNVLLVNGKRVEVIARVCMDQVMIRLDPDIQAWVGDEVVIIGRQANECISAEEVGERWGTNNYEVVCSIGERVPRLYSSDAAGESNFKAA
jgi:alanine racemase